MPNCVVGEDCLMAGITDRHCTCDAFVQPLLQWKGMSIIYSEYASVALTF
jgi:hypothetical protein